MENKYTTYSMKGSENDGFYLNKPYWNLKKSELVDIIGHLENEINELKTKLENTIPVLEFGKCFNFNSKHNKLNNLTISSIQKSGIYNEYILTAYEAIKELKGE